eukprot:15471827-Alexandrium_andersonii.AAC.1
MPNPKPTRNPKRMPTKSPLKKPFRLMNIPTPRRLVSDQIVQAVVVAALALWWRGEGWQGVA